MLYYIGLCLSVAGVLLTASEITKMFRGRIVIFITVCLKAFGIFAATVAVQLIVIEKLGITWPNILIGIISGIIINIMTDNEVEA